MDHQDNHIHPTAIIGPGVSLGLGNRIGPNAVLEGEITIGDHNQIDAGVVMTNRIRIGNSNHIYPYVTIGHLGEMGAKGDRFVEDGQVKIGNNVTIREFVNIHSPVRTTETFVGDDCYIMNKCYLAHDVKIDHHAILSAGVKLGGRCEVGAYANLGMGAAVHHRICIGRGAMVGMNAAVVKHILPFTTVAGSPARILSFNRLGAVRSGISESDLELIESKFLKSIKGEAELDHEVSQIIKDFLTSFPDSLTQIK